MVSKLLAGLILVGVAPFGVFAAEKTVVPKAVSSGTILVASESADEKRLEWDDADATPDKPKSSPENREPAPRGKADAEPSDAARRTTSGEDVSPPKPSATNSSETTTRNEVAAKPEAAPPSARDIEPAKSGGAPDASGLKPARRSSDAAKARSAQKAAKESSRVVTARTADRGRAPRGSAERVWMSPDDDPALNRSEPGGAYERRTIRTAQAVRRPATIAAAPGAEEVASRRSTPISGGILCGGGAKWRCNWIEREHDKFYKFTKGHGWTDQTMATDFCATERQMRVASATRIKSIQGGCCGFVVVQVTCRR